MVFVLIVLWTRFLRNLFQASHEVNRDNTLFMIIYEYETTIDIVFVEILFRSGGRALGDAWFQCIHFVQLFNHPI